MERLTERNHVYHTCEFMDSGVDVYLNKLAKYEDAEEQGLLLRLPYKVGDSVYFRVKGMNQFSEYVDFIQVQKITRIDIQEDGILYCSATEKFIESDINKTIFLTRSEAEQSLEKMKEES